MLIKLFFPVPFAIKLWDGSILHVVNPPPSFQLMFIPVHTARPPIIESAVRQALHNPATCL